VLELEGIPSSRISRIGLKSRGCRATIPLAIADGLDRPLDAAIRILGKRDVGIAITQLYLGRRLRARPNIPLLKASVVRIERKQ